MEVQNKPIYVDIDLFVQKDQRHLYKLKVNNTQGPVPIFFSESNFVKIIIQIK
jgi:hypothetical protein